MKLFSSFFIIFSLFSIVIDITLYNNWQIYLSYLKNKELFTILILFCVSSSFGQIFIFILLEKYGPLTLSMVTGIRKILSITLSIILFGKTISLFKFFSLILGSFVIFSEIYDKFKRHDKKETEEVDQEEKKIREKFKVRIL